MKNIGLFFGSFNPIHFGHLAVAQYFTENTDLEQVWLVISPQSPFKKKKELIENHHRLAMVECAIKGQSKLKACDEEFYLPTPNYTIDTLLHLKKKFPKNQFTLLLGADNIADFDQWKDYTQILDQFSIHVYPRSQSGIVKSEFLNHPKITFFKASLLEISSTEIRKALLKGKSVSQWVPPSVSLYLKSL